MTWADYTASMSTFVSAVLLVLCLAPVIILFCQPMHVSFDKDAPPRSKLEVAQDFFTNLAAVALILGVLWLLSYMAKM